MRVQSNAFSKIGKIPLFQWILKVHRICPLIKYERFCMLCDHIIYLFGLNVYPLLHSTNHPFALSSIPFQSFCVYIIVNYIQSLCGLEPGTLAVPGKTGFCWINMWILRVKKLNNDKMSWRDRGSSKYVLGRN